MSLFSGKAYTVDIIAIGLTIGAESIKVIATDNGNPFFKKPLATGIVPQSHTGNSIPNNEAIIQGIKVFLDNNFDIVFSEIHTCIIEDTKAPIKIKGTVSIIIPIKIVLKVFT